MLFERTNNISVNSFSSLLQKTSQVNQLIIRKVINIFVVKQEKNVIACAHQCLYYKNSGGICNAYSYSNVSQLCELASLTFLEDPLPDGSDGGEKKVKVEYYYLAEGLTVTMKVMVESAVLDTLPRTCRGGEHCCRPDYPCALNYGDCNHEYDCQVMFHNI